MSSDGLQQKYMSREMLVKPVSVGFNGKRSGVSLCVCAPVSVCACVYNLTTPSLHNDSEEAEVKDEMSSINLIWGKVTP